MAVHVMSCHSNGVQRPAAHALGLQLLLLLCARAPAGAAGAALVADIRNCSLLPQTQADRYAFVAASRATNDHSSFIELKWKHDLAQCLVPASSAGCGSTPPWRCAPTAVLIRPCSAAGKDASWARVAPPKRGQSVGGAAPGPATGSDGFLLSPAGNTSLCLRAQPNFGAALLLPCFDDPWNAKLDSDHLSHPHSHPEPQALGGSERRANPCCDKQPCGSAVCSAAVCAACPAALGHCPQLGGTVWRLDSGGRLIASMSNPMQVANSSHPVCSHFNGCIGVLAAPTPAALKPLAWQPIPLSTPLRPTAGGWMHAQLVAQRMGFGGHEYPMAGGGVNDVHSVWRDEWLGGGFASGMGGELAEGYPYW
eukprot:SAG22_NODE_754_length_7443_cov_4.952478_1_plen_366_part_00